MSKPYTDVYLVRHAETYAGKSGTYPQDNSKVTPVGLFRALKKGFSLKDVNADALLYSSLSRANTTSQCFNLFLHLKRHEVELLDERRMTQNNSSIEWEDLESIKKRIEEFLQYIREQKENTIIAVTHATIMKFLYTYIKERDLMDEGMFEEFNKNNKLKPLDSFCIRVFPNSVSILKPPLFFSPS